MKQKYIRKIHCHSCNKLIDRPPSQTSNKYNFCDHQCYSKHKVEKWSNENNPRWTGGEEKFTCKFCGKSCQRKKGKEKNKYCSIECSAKDREQQGENHWNWKGGNNSRYLKKTAPRTRPEKCEVCGSYGGKRNGIVLDHNHKTGEFRGWLCSNCNTAIGLTKENTKTLKALIKYINENGKNCWKA